MAAPDQPSTYVTRRLGTSVRPGTKTAHMLLLGAAAAGLVHGAFSLYWAAGGRWLLDTVGAWAVDMADRSPGPAVALLLAVAGVKVGGALCPLLNEAGRLPGPAAIWRRVFLAGAVLLIAYGGLNTVGAWIGIAIDHCVSCRTTAEVGPTQVITRRPHRNRAPARSRGTLGPAVPALGRVAPARDPSQPTVIFGVGDLGQAHGRPHLDKQPVTTAGCPYEDGQRDRLIQTTGSTAIPDSVSQARTVAWCVPHAAHESAAHE